MNCHFDPETHTYTIDGVRVPGVTAILKEMGLMPNCDFYTPGSAERGTDIHMAAQLLDMGSLDWSTVADEYMEYVIAYEKFKKDFQFIPEVIERPGFNTVSCFGGTPDRVGKVTINGKGKRVLIDLKSGNVEPWAALQTAAYTTFYPNDYLERYAVQLKSDGNYRVHHFTNTQDQQIFLGLVAAYHWKHNHYRKGK